MTTQSTLQATIAANADRACGCIVKKGDTITCSCGSDCKCGTDCTCTTCSCKK